MPTVTGPAVTLDGNPVEGALVAVINNDTGEVLDWTTTDVDGNWTTTVAGGQTVQARIKYRDANGDLYQEYNKPDIVVEATEPTTWAEALHRYNHDEGTGTTLADTGAATAADATLTGATWDTANFKYGGASVSYDGVDDSAEAPARDTQDGFTSGMTVLSWVYPRDVTARQDVATVGSSWIVRIDSGSWHIYVYDGASGSYTRYVLNTPAPTVDTWYRYGFRWTASNHVEILVDGAAYPHDAIGGAGTAADTIASTANPLDIASPQLYNGLIDGPLMIWDRALTDAEVQDDYNAFA